MARVGKSDFSVYGVEADWETQTAESTDPAGGWRDLLVDAPLVKLEGP